MPAPLSGTYHMPAKGPQHQADEKLTTAGASSHEEPRNDVPRGAGANTGAGVTRPKTEAEIEADRRYEEAMEEEYAKREGGA